MQMLIYCFVIVLRTFAKTLQSKSSRKPGFRPANAGRSAKRALVRSGQLLFRSRSSATRHRAVDTVPRGRSASLMWQPLEDVQFDPSMVSSLASL